MSEERSCETCADGNGVGGCRLAIPDFTPDLQCWSPSLSSLQKKLTEALEENTRLKNGCMGDPERLAAIRDLLANSKQLKTKSVALILACEYLLSLIEKGQS